MEISPETHTVIMTCKNRHGDSYHSDKDEDGEHYFVSEREFESPKNDREEKLVEIWKEILGLTKVSTNEDYRFR